MPRKHLNDKKFHVRKKPKKKNLMLKHEEHEI